MHRYIATFFTHFDAVVFAKKLRTAGYAAQPMPVPRRLSSSCGTCVSFALDSDPLVLCDNTVERLAQALPDGSYTTLWQNE